MNVSLPGSKHPPLSPPIVQLLSNFKSILQIGQIKGGLGSKLKRALKWSKTQELAHLDVASLVRVVDFKDRGVKWTVSSGCPIGIGKPLFYKCAVFI